MAISCVHGGKNQEYDDSVVMYTRSVYTLRGAILFINAVAE